MVVVGSGIFFFFNCGNFGGDRWQIGVCLWLDLVEGDSVGLQERDKEKEKK